VQILPIESFLFVAWHGIPLQKLCVLWVHWWLCLVCHACDCFHVTWNVASKIYFLERQFYVPLFPTSSLSLAQALRLKKKFFLLLMLPLIHCLFFQAFEEHGEIEEGAVIYDKVTGKSRGYGFITFKNMESTQQALRASSKLIDVSFTPFYCFGSWSLIYMNLQFCFRNIMVTEFASLNFLTCQSQYMQTMRCIKKIILYVVLCWGGLFSASKQPVIRVCSLFSILSHVAESNLHLPTLYCWETVRPSDIF